MTRQGPVPLGAIGELAGSREASSEGMSAVDSWQRLTLEAITARKHLADRTAASRWRRGRYIWR